MSPVSIGTSRSTQALRTGEAKLWLLLVGVNQYQDGYLPSLRYSALDCQGLSEALAEATQAFPHKEVKIYHDSAAQLPRLGIVWAGLQQIVSAARPQDTVLFYFSGHGVLDPHSQQAVLCLADTRKDTLLGTGLRLQKLLQELGNCAARQQLVWLDACHSGGMTLRGARGKPEVLLNPTPQLVAVLRKRAAQSSGFYALLSCDQAQQSWEFPELGHGVFTYYLMRGLRGEAADAHGTIEADGLYKYVYHQTLQYIDKTNQQLRLINQQKRVRGETHLQSEYPLQTPKRIVEGVGELILGLRPADTELRYPRQALVVDGLASSQTSLSLSKVLRKAGGFELNYWPQPGGVGLREAIQTCLQSGGEHSYIKSPETSTALLYLRGRVKPTDAGDARLVFKEELEISRSWLRQELRHSGMTQQIVILDCPRAETLADWVEDLVIGAGGGQCLIAAAAPNAKPELFAQALLDTLVTADPQVGLPIAGWIAQLQAHLAGTGIPLHTWLSGTQGVIEVLPGKHGQRSGTSGTFDLGLCPYRGLKAFAEEDAPFFFGRENLTQRLINTLNQQSFLAVVGASGSGKSSVVHAGLMAQLRQGKQLPGSEHWWIRSFRPGTHPLDVLAQRLVDSGSEKERTYQQLQLEGMLYQGVEGMVRWLRSRPESMVVLVVDQFEELFTLAAAEERQQFLDLVLGAVEYAGDRFKLVITLRTDFIAPCLEHPALAQALQRSSVLVPPRLNQEDYSQVIIRPAEKVGLRVEPELVEVLLQELSQGAGDLPLLEVVLEQVWEHRHPGELTLDIYQQQIGGLKGALERKAQAVYESLDDQAQACARWIFLSLTQLGEGTEDTRRRVLKSELVVAKYPAPLVEQTLQALTAAKLVIVSLEEEMKRWGDGEHRSRGESVCPPGAEENGSRIDAQKGGRPEITCNPNSKSPDPEELPQILQQEVTVEVAHEILIRHWSTLRWWLEENRARLRSQRQIEQAAQQWKQSAQQPDFLLRGIRLATAEEIYIKYTDELSQDVQRFIEAGLKEREQQQLQAKRRLRQAQMTSAIIGTLAITALSFGILAYWQRQQVRLKWIGSLNSLSESQLLSGQALEALVSSVKAGKQLQDLNGFGIGSNQAAEAQIKTASTLQQVISRTYEINRLEDHTQRVNRVSVSPDGQLLASGSDDQTIRLWKPDGTLVNILDEHEDRVTDVAFSPDGTTLASASADGTVNLWSVQNLTTKAEGRGQRAEGESKISNPQSQIENGDWVTRVAFSPDGQVLATASRDQTVKLWNPDNGTLLKTLSEHQGWVNALSFSPDGEILASASEDQTIRLWSPTDGTLLQMLTGHADRVTSVAFSPDGQTLASSSGDRTVKLWNVIDGTSQTFTRQDKGIHSHRDQVNSVSFSPDGQTIVSASADGTLRLWSIDGTLLETLSGHGAEVLSVSFTPNGQTLISASADKSVRLWRVATPEVGAYGDPPLQTISAFSTSFNPDGKMFAVAGWDGTIQLWRTDELASRRLFKTLAGHESPVFSIDFSPDGQLLASGSDDQTIKLWNPANGVLLGTLTGHQGIVNSVSFKPDSSLLASGSGDQTIKLWNPINGTLIDTLTGHEDGVTSVAFSPNGKILASGSYDNTVKLWRTNGTLLKTLEGHGLAIAALSFSPDGKTLASASWDNAIKLWQVNDGTLLQTLAGHEDGVTSVSFSPDGKTLVSGSADQTMKFWNLSDGTLVKTLLGHPDLVRSISFSPDGQTLITASETAGVLLWNLNLDNLLERGCDRLQDYLQTNPSLKESDRQICDD